MYANESHDEHAMTEMTHSFKLITFWLFSNDVIFPEFRVIMQAYFKDGKYAKQYSTVVKVEWENAIAGNHVLCCIEALLDSE